jgi:hypothetical protein
MAAAGDDPGGVGPARAGPRLSVVLPTDTFDTIRPVLERLDRQTVSHVVEAVVVLPASVAAVGPPKQYGRLASIRTVATDSIRPLGRARAAGVRAATAPVVFIGETHTYPDEGFAEALIEGLQPPWAAAAPGFTNANPTNAVSWAGFLADYGRWAEGRPAGEIREVPLYNSAFRRALLLEMGERLDHALECGDELRVWLDGRGQRVYFEPGARIAHLNIARLGDFVREHLAIGVLVGASRARRWTLLRRLAYAGGAILIPAVLAARVLPGVWRTSRRHALPLATYPLIGLATCVRAFGELLAYAGADGRFMQQQMYEYEVHKLAYAAPPDA